MTGVDMDRNSIIQRIQQFQQMTVENGCSESEAETAVRKASDLLNQYNVLLSEIEVRNEEMVQHSYRVGTARVHPVQLVLAAVGNLCNVKTWIVTNFNTEPWSKRRNLGPWSKPRKSTDKLFMVFGHKHDVEIALYLIREDRDYSTR